MELEYFWPSLHQHKMKWNTRNQCKAVWMSSKPLLTNNPLKHHHYFTHTRQRSRVGHVWKWEWRMPHLYSPALVLPMCPLAQKNMGELGPNLALTTELQVGILQNFVLTTVGSAEAAGLRLLPIQSTFLLQSFYRAGLPANMQHIPMGRPKLGLAFVLQNKELW